MFVLGEGLELELKFLGVRGSLILIWKGRISNFLEVVNFIVIKNNVGILEFL